MGAAYSSLGRTKVLYVVIVQPVLAGALGLKRRLRNM